MQVSNTRLWHRMGARTLNRSICGAAAETAVKATLGRGQSKALPRLSNNQKDVGKFLYRNQQNPCCTLQHVEKLQ